MRFERIELPAFGPFTDFALDLSARPGALHVVYGPNEAGKSSLLRALIALLYGVPARSGDGHTHDFTRLRIGAVLRSHSGELLHVVRRKGNKHTLLDRDERPLADGLLTPLLGGLDETLFRQMFGLDHERLREGAEALLRGGGNIGEGLFDAGTGARAIRHALDALRAEADELYKARGRTPKLNVSVELLREQRRKLRDAMLSPQAYVDQQKGLADALSEREQVARQRLEALAEQARLTRQLALHPLLTQHAALTLELTRLSAELTQSGGAQLGEGTELGEALRALGHRLGTLHAFRAEQPERAAELASLERAVEQLSLRLGSVAHTAPELDTPTRARLRRFAQEERTLTRDREQLEQRTCEQRERLLRSEQRLSELATVDRGEAALSELLSGCERDNFAAELARIDGELARTAQLIERGIAQSGLHIAPAALSLLALPTEALVRELEEEHERCARAGQQVGDAQRKVEAQRQVAARRRAELLAHGALVSDTELAAAEQARSRALAGVLDGWRAGAPFSAELAHECERSLARVDELARSMRAEAHRYAELRRVDAELAQLAEEQRALSLAAEACTTQRSAADQRLSALAAELGWPSGLHVRELRGKLAKLNELRALAEQRDNLSRELARSAAQAEAQCETLVQAKAAIDHRADEPLSARLARAVAKARSALHLLREQKSELRHLEAQRNEFATAIAVASARLSSLDEAKAELRSRFADELSRHGLNAALSADELLACLDELAELAQKQRDLSARRERFAHMHGFEAELLADLEQLAERCGHDVEGLGAARALELLTAEKHNFVELSRSLEQRRAELAKLEQQLALHGEGATIEQLHASCREFDPDLGRAQKAELDGELERLAERLREIDQRLGALRAGLARLEEPSSAIQLSEESECELASARALARRYVEIRLATTLLTREIERYRTEHQGPVLARASQLFPRLTLGRYVALEVDYDERDEPVIACVQKSGKRVHVGGLSDGTRDQLYLALRVASIERFIDANAPLPLILDDAFVHFDDARAEAALSVLSELAQRTQVLFFTHHARMVELAKRALGRERVCVHQLAGDSNILLYDHGPLFA